MAQCAFGLVMIGYAVHVGGAWPEILLAFYGVDTICVGVGNIVNGVRVMPQNIRYRTGWRVRVIPRSDVLDVETKYDIVGQRRWAFPELVLRDGTTVPLWIVGNHAPLPLGTPSTTAQETTATLRELLHIPDQDS